MASAQTPAHMNRLGEATSPYLLQHKHNPVDWWTWGPEALAEAKALNRPILLSVGYAACHWCHVMAHESFEDEATARVMNELFVNIKVDREERPDIDQIYMNALHLLGEQGGWPLTMFLTPRAEPVWGGTYFPKESRFGRPAFVDVLQEVARLFREEPAQIEQNRAALLARLADKARPAGKVTIGLKELDAAAMQIGNMFDPVNGGLRGAPKFPQPAILEMLWRAGLRTNDLRFFETVEHSLERMCEGGIYDHLGGGFSRYSVDEKWLVGWSRLGDRLRLTSTAEFAGYDWGWTPRDFNNILKLARDLFPDAADYDRGEYRACLRPMTPDGPPILGLGRHRNLFFNSGHGHMGWTMACGTARIVADLMMGRMPALDLEGLTVRR